MPDDPRKFPGSIVGPGGPYDEDSVVMDTTNALLLDENEVSLVGGIRKGEPLATQVVAIELGGRVNKTKTRANFLVLTNADGAAALVTQLIGLASRAGFREEFLAAVQERMGKMPL